MATAVTDFGMLSIGKKIEGAALWRTDRWEKTWQEARPRRGKKHSGPGVIGTLLQYSYGNHSYIAQNLLVLISRRVCLRACLMDYYGIITPFPGLCKSRPYTGQHRVRSVLHGIYVSDDEEQDIEVEDIDFDSDGDTDEKFVENQTLNLFEWQDICVQVGEFACTPTGKTMAKEGRLAIGASQDESEQLQEQTASAGCLVSPLDFTGIEDLHSIVRSSISGNVCLIKELCSVKQTLMGVKRVYDQLFKIAAESELDGPSLCLGKDGLQAGRMVNSKSDLLLPLQNIMAGCDLCLDVIREIDYCLDCTVSSVLDQASPALASARLERQQNMRTLEALLKETSAWIVQQGGIDSPLVTRRCSRLCIAVRTSHKSLLPGGVTLDVSNSGATMFVEPEPALRLNNEEMRLKGVEKDEETVVLKKLTLKLVCKAEAILDLMGRVTVIDLACARASHAAWLGSVRPFFKSKIGEEDRHPTSNMANSLPSEKQKSGHTERSCGLMIDIDHVRHPQLLGVMLPKLPVSSRFGIINPRKSSMLKDRVSEVPLVEQEKLPVPIDIKVPMSAKVVTITGPNTGGKTAALKTVGVVAIMAKAGLFLPAVGHPSLPWFDHVLADIGDEQSLEQSLSTFSGHIRRLCGILEACTEHSLVLLDELGGGTDPSEGAALASAMLKYLSDKALLTIATTHSAELKVLGDLDPRFENASVEFDIKSLRPTYRVLWGMPGQSNALNIADSLGLDAKILARARHLVTKFVPNELGIRTSQLIGSLMEQRNEQQRNAKIARELSSKAKILHSELHAAADRLVTREAVWRKFQEDTELHEISKAKVKMDQVIEKFQESLETAREDAVNVSLRKAQSEIAAIVYEFCVHERQFGFEDLLTQVNVSNDTSIGSVPLALNDKVVVKKLGKTPATVIELPQKDSQYLTVQLGTMKVQVKSSEVLKLSSSGSTPSKIEKQQKVIRMKAVKPAEGIAPTFERVVQTSRNTVDLRGMRVTDAMRELDMALASARAQSVLFIVHGIGTGAVKEATLQTLRKHQFVAKFEEESITNGGCTIAYIK